MSSPTLTVLLVAAAALAVIAAAAPTPEHHKAYKQHRPYGSRADDSYDAKEDQIDGLPDYMNPAVAKQLKCSACKVLMDELYDRLKAIHNDRKPKMYEVVDVVEGVCADVRDNYGLLMRSNQATNEFSRNKAITRMKGAWINTYLEGRCGELMSHHEESIVEEFPRVQAVEQLMQLVCWRLEQSCAHETAPTDDGDEL
jgi:hypothetical protein